LAVQSFPTKVGSFSLNVAYYGFVAPFFFFFFGGMLESAARFWAELEWRAGAGVAGKKK
jgi:hypothetical protein